MVMLESRPASPANRTWSFHQEDALAANQQHLPAWLTRLVAHRFTGTSVRFPSYTRRLTRPFLTMSGGSLMAGLSAAGIPVHYDTIVDTVHSGKVTTRSGQEHTAPLIFDSRPTTSVTRGAGFKSLWAGSYSSGAHTR